MTTEIKTAISINARPEKIWNILIDTNQYPSWNPFIKKIEGKWAVGNQIKVTVQPENASEMTFKPKILSFQENKQILWKGKFIINHLFDGAHKLELIDNKNGTTTFIQSEEFSGILVRFINLNNTQKGFENMNQKLKEICEKQ
jgi:hypothetical protein